MQQVLNTAELLPMSNETRGRAITKRRMALGITSRSGFEQAMKDQAAKNQGWGKHVSREKIAAAEEGSASDAIYERLETWLNRMEEETNPAAGESADAKLVTFHIAAIGVTVKGPVSDLAEIEAAVARLIQDTRTGE